MYPSPRSQTTPHRRSHGTCTALLTLLLVASISFAEDTPSRALQDDPQTASSADETTPASTGSSLEAFVATHIGEPSIVPVTSEVFVAVGYDIANVVVVRTPEGNVLIDTGSCTPQAELIREQMAEVVPGPPRAIVYTHGAIEQLGGAGAWVGNEEIPIYGTALLKEEFLRQLVLLQPAELRRGIRQFGMLASEDTRTTTAWGRPPEYSQLEGVPQIRLPNQTFVDQATFTIGGVEFQLYAAPGESPDQLFVWIPSSKTLLAGDNFVSGFPKICGIRGAPQRNADHWIASLDRMRALGAEHLVSAHHLPISGQDEVQAALTAHRDAIQWLRDETMRAINQGESADNFAARIKLPRRLEESPYLTQVTGCVEWAARSLYSSYSGWFDERADMIRPLAPKTAAEREIELMGGADAVFAAANKARAEGDHAWSVHLLAKLQRAGLTAEESDNKETPTAGAGTTTESVNAALADSLDGLAAETEASDVKTYLASMASELRTPIGSREPWPCPSDDTLREVPLEAFFRSMALGLKPEETTDVHETIYVIITDEEREFVLTLRHGILEVVEGSPLPGTPKAVASITTDGLTWRKMCLRVANPTVEIVAGRATVKGSLQMVRRFSNYFACPNEYERPQDARRGLTALMPAKAIP